ncbi:hypothetical protein ACAW74_12285 [Fibrella sp. WM1]|uniref:hypothetical protein n=1 Tax=Fibrella musci TaxID=3242485 RepID=UPI0035203D21
MQTDKTPTYAVPIEDAEKWVTNWVDANTDGKTLDPTDMRAFLVHREDFIELLRQYDTEYVRLYMGRREDPNSDNQLRACLLMVSATRQGTIDPKSPDPDLIVDLVGQVTVLNGDKAQEANYQVFDFSQICPPMCDVNSPLFIGEPDARCQ